MAHGSPVRSISHTCSSSTPFTSLLATSTTCDLKSSTLKELDLLGSHVKAIRAGGVHIDGGLNLHNVTLTLDDHNHNKTAVVLDLGNAPKSRGRPRRPATQRRTAFRGPIGES